MNRFIFTFSLIVPLLFSSTITATNLKTFHQIHSLIEKESLTYKNHNFSEDEMIKHYLENINDPYAKYIKPQKRILNKKKIRLLLTAFYLIP